MKPSEWIGAKTPEIREQFTTIALDVAAKISGYQFTPDDRAEFLASDDGKKMVQQIEPAVVAGVTLAYLDEEHERRARFEEEVLERLARLEQAHAVRAEHRERVTVVIPCSDRMPEAERRVMFLVPGLDDPDRRWRVGCYTCPPIYLDSQWRDEESEVGDVGISWRLDQVTHWMPMPGEPT